MFSIQIVEPKIETTLNIMYSSTTPPLRMTLIINI